MKKAKTKKTPKAQGSEMPKFWKKGEKYCLPDGMVTTDADKYIDSYRALGRMIEEVTNGDVVLGAFDPGLTLYVTEKGKHKYRESLSLPSSFLLSLMAFLRRYGWKPRENTNTAHDR